MIGFLLFLLLVLLVVVTLPIGAFLYFESINNSDETKSERARMWMKFSLIWSPIILLTFHQAFFNTWAELWESEMINAFGASNISWAGIIVIPSCLVCWVNILRELNQSTNVVRSLNLRLSCFTLCCVYFWFGVSSGWWGLIPLGHAILLVVFYVSLPDDIENQVKTQKEKNYQRNWVLTHIGVFGLKAWSGFFVIDQIPRPVSVNCFVTSAACQGHKNLVGSFVLNNHLVNHQVLNFKKFEYILLLRCPKIHFYFRKYYNHYGRIIASKVKNKLMADLIFVSLLPLELCAKIINGLFSDCRVNKMLSKYLNHEN